MSTIERSIEMKVPAQTAYDQWTQFESFPEFMSNVEHVRQKDERHLSWRTRVGPKLEEWESEITEQIPGKRIAWTTTQGAKHAGVVTFHRLSDDSSRVMLQMDVQPETVTEKAGEKLGLLERWVEKNLEDFKSFIESRGSATGSWRGEIPAPDDRSA